MIELFNMLGPEIRVILLDIADLGITNHFGYRVGSVKIKCLFNENTLEEIIGYYDPRYRENIIWSIEHFQKQRGLDELGILE